MHNTTQRLSTSRYWHVPCCTQCISNFNTVGIYLRYITHIFLGVVLNTHIVYIRHSIVNSMSQSQYSNSITEPRH